MRTTIIASLLFTGQFLFGQSQPAFIVYTGDTIGFREGNQFFRLGIHISQFAKHFGNPEQKHTYKDTALGSYWCYSNDGIEAIVDADSIVRSFIFHFLKTRGFEPKYMLIDSEITKGASRREIERAYGQPTKVLDSPIIGKMDLMYWKKDSTLISFTFDNGKFSHLLLSIKNKK
jgi:hypothetical protein